MIIAIYALEANNGLTLHELDPNLLRDTFVTMPQGTLVSTVHWTLEDANYLVERIREQSGSADFDIQKAQVDSLGKLVQREIDTARTIKYDTTRFEVPTK